ncbi:unnamed protein product [Phytophthora fragariaefolia]|uniref:Unnamed protein product n=1 Tax=Phytophthora fragariaefolia TaxID=1490495 RepID=A0A9W6Y843_9STRA|nr:unnamed protein product [Phytophthora fragariaefolia]
MGEIAKIKNIKKANSPSRPAVKPILRARWSSVHHSIRLVTTPLILQFRGRVLKFVTWCDWLFERLMCRYVGLKDTEDSKKAERTESRNKKAKADRIGGADIRDAAVSVERPHKKKSSASKRLDPLAFLKALKDDMKSGREEENRRRENNEAQIHGGAKQRGNDASSVEGV